MRAWIIGALAALLVGVTVLGPAVGIGDAERAHALCTTSINPTCNPANVPILVEAGILTAGTAAPGAPSVGGATTKVPKRPGGGWGGLVFQAISTVVPMFNWGQSYEDPDGGGLYDGAAVVTDKGLVDQKITAPKEIPAQDSGLTIPLDQLDAGGFWRAGPQAAQVRGFDPNYRAGHLRGNVLSVKLLDDRTAEVALDITDLEGDSSTTPGIINEMYLYCSTPGGELSGRKIGPDRFTQPGVQTYQGDCGSTNHVIRYLGTTDPRRAYVSTRSKFSMSWSPFVIDLANTVWVAPSVRGAQGGTVKRQLKCRDSAGVERSFTDSTFVALGSTTPLPDLVCPDGMTPSTVSSNWFGPDARSTDILPSTSIKAPDLPPEYKQNPNCLSGGCVLELRRDGKTCGNTGELCLDWAEDWVTQPQRYTCLYGGAPVDIRMCSAYRAPKVGVLPNMTATGTLLLPSAPLPEKLPNVGTQQKPATNPGGTVLPDGDSCWANGYAEVANPLDWVLVPIKCALVWAFVPRQSVIDANAQMIQTTYAASGPGKLAEATSHLGTIWNVPQGCEGLPFNVDAFGIKFRGRLFEACADPWLGIAATVRGIIGAVVLVGGFLAILRYGAGVFGFIGLGMGVGDHAETARGVRFR